MKKFSKLICIILAFVLVATLTGCGKTGKTETTNQEESESKTQTSNAESNSESNTSEASTASEPVKKYLIGYSHVTETNPFFVLVKNTVEEAAKKHGIEIISATTERDPAVMNSNVDSFLMQGVDLVIDFNVVPEAGSLIAKRLKEQGIPMISIDSVYEDAYFFGVNNETAGRLLGDFMLEQVQTKWNGQVDYLVLFQTDVAGPAVRLRTDMVAEVFLEKIPGFSQDQIIQLECPGDAIKAKAQMSDVLTAHPDAEHIVVASYSDDNILGILPAIDEVQRNEHCIVGSHNAGKPFTDNIDNPINVGSVAYFPEKYGEYVIQMALDILEGKDVPQEKYMDHVVITKDNYEQYLGN